MSDKLDEEIITKDNQIPEEKHKYRRNEYRKEYNKKYAEYRNNYVKENLKVILFRINKYTDEGKKIIQRIESVDNINLYLRTLVLEDIKKEERKKKREEKKMKELANPDILEGNNNQGK